MYKGGEGQWSWILHRITGVGVLLFLYVHIIDTALVGFGPDVYNAVMDFYHMPIFRVGQIALVGALLFHALNGIRIMIIDFWPATTRHHRAMFYGVVVLFVVLFVPAAWMMVRPLLR